MCGIFAYIGKKTAEQIKLNLSALKTLEARGPDNTSSLDLSVCGFATERQFTDMPCTNLWFGFTRLAINGCSDVKSNQPMHLENVWLMCNGEIFNCHQLQQKYKFNYYSKSDCEVILHLYHRFGFEEMLKNLVGVFSIALYDKTKNTLFLANDRIGIRPLYWGYKRGDASEDYKYFFASEPIALHTAGAEFIDFFKPGTYCSLKLDDPLSLLFQFLRSDMTVSFPYTRYYGYDWKPTISVKTHALEEILGTIRELLEQSVDRRMMSDRPIATLLSGGIDSSLVASLIARDLKKSGDALAKVVQSTPELLNQQRMSHGRVHTFSIGLKGSPDLHYAEIVAKHIGSVHHPVICTEDEFLSAIPEVVRAIQSWDTTTVRASVGNYLIAKYIKAHSDFTVIFNGDVSEEVNASYYYSRFAPTSEAFHQDNITLMKEVHQFDVLRSARCIESQGLEPRTPFADQDFVNYMMSIDPTLKMVGEKYFPIEKYLLRKAFEGTGLLPDSIIWRPKEAFSDGVSDSGRSWHKILQEHVSKLVSDSEFESGKLKYAYHCPPRTKEEYYYRRLFEEILPGHAKMITKYWMPRFVKNVNDPSAREIKLFM